MAKVSSGVTLTADFYLNNFYQANRSARKSSGRKELTTNELSYEDGRALKRAISRLGSYSFSDDDNLENVQSTIQAFADTYNNTLESTAKSDSSDLRRQSRQLKAMAEKYSDQLRGIGITVEKDGSMSVSKTTLKGADISEIKKVFSKETSDLLKKANSIARRVSSNSYDALYQELTGNGGKINITL